MKLKEFTPENCAGRSVRITRAAIGFTPKSGIFRLNTAASELLGLKAGDQVKLHQDEGSPEDWYIEKVKSGGFTVRENSKLTTGVAFNSTQLAKNITESIGSSKSCVRMLIAGQATVVEKRKLYGLLNIAAA